MKVLVINGNPKDNRAAFDDYLEALSIQLTQRGHQVKLLQLREMDIKDCIGCYGCWLKTPGLCVLKDDMDEILRAHMSSDLVLYASPLLAGYVSALLKRVQERMLPLVHPYLMIEGDRMKHLPRYDKYPKTALLLDGLAQAGPGTRDMLAKVYESGRHAYVFTKTMEDQPEEIAYEIDHL